MTCCPACNSIWMRPTDPAWTGEGTAAWTRRFHCGECGGVFVVRVTRIGSSPTDGDKNKHRDHTEPKVMVGNGGEAA